MWRKSWWHHRWGRYGWSIAWVERAAIRVFKGVGFDLRTWNSNVPELEADKQLTDDSQTYAKEQLEVKPNEAKLLGLPWEKVEDTLAVTFLGDWNEATKREVLKNFALAYDLLGVASPVTLIGDDVRRNMWPTPPSGYCFTQKTEITRETGLVSLNFHAV